MKWITKFLGTLVLMGGVAAAESAWPEIGAEQKPWTRWWWLGSGVDEKNLTKELEAFSAAGIGGVEICPIYGAMDYESRNLDFLSEKWMAALAHTIREASRLGMGVDMTTGTGWPFGGPQVGKDIATKGLVRVKKEVISGEKYHLKVDGEVVVLRAIGPAGEIVDLEDSVKEGVLDWQSPDGGNWTVLGLTVKSPIQQVKRAAPGGAGNVLDPYSGDALKKYLTRFDEAFRGFIAPWPRAQFHDSFEYYNAEWSPDILKRFRERNGYELLDHLPEFLGTDDAAGRVRADWRGTLSDMHLDYLSNWHDWANGHGSLTRNQAHGSPGNLLDHYAVSDIPETEIFRKVEDAQIPMIGMAASAAHLTGRRLNSAESFTWLGEHFQVTPAELKEAADFLYLSGVNHLFFHGIPYSPDDVPWPGWLFYASTNMGPNGGLWRDMPAFTTYLARIQSILQGGRPDSGVMLYFPFDDMVGGDGEALKLFTIHNQGEWLHDTPFHRIAMELWNSGVPWDAVSARLMEGAKVESGEIVLGDVKAKVLVVPGARLLPLAVLKRLLALKEAGARVIFTGGLPVDVPGYGNLEERRAEFEALLKSVDARQVLAESRLIEKLEEAGVMPEPMCRLGLRLVRRAREDGSDYFVVNRSGQRVDAFVGLSRPFASALLLDPADEKRQGSAESRGEKIRLVLEMGESVVIRCYDRKQDGKAYPYRVQRGEPLVVNGEWKLEFVDGGPELPQLFTMRELESWTRRDDPRLMTFSGSAGYALDFDLEKMPNEGLLLDLGKVGQPCRVTLNGAVLGSSFFPPHRFEVSGVVKVGRNSLKVEVTNLAANRIADLDRRKVDWKRFHEINFVDIDYKPFDASGWEPLESGLLGPVRLVPVR